MEKESNSSISSDHGAGRDALSARRGVEDNQELGIREDLLEKIHALSDLELAALICMVADQHCVVEAEKEDLDGVGGEIRMVGFLPLCGAMEKWRCYKHTQHLAISNSRAVAIRLLAYNDDNTRLYEQTLILIDRDQGFQSHIRRTSL